MDWARRFAMSLLGIGLSDAEHFEDALSVQEAELSMRQRLGDAESNILAVQGNLAVTYHKLGRLEETLRLRRVVYSECLKIDGESHRNTLVAANNYAATLGDLQHYKEARSLVRKNMPVARRVLGDSHDLTLQMMAIYAAALYRDTGATLDDLRKAVTTLEETERIARRVFGGGNPLTVEIEDELRVARAALARDTPSPSA